MAFEAPAPDLGATQAFVAPDDGPDNALGATMAFEEPVEDEERSYFPFWN